MSINDLVALGMRPASKRQTEEFEKREEARAARSHHSEAIDAAFLNYRYGCHPYTVKQAC